MPDADTSRGTQEDTSSVIVSDLQTFEPHVDIRFRSSDEAVTTYEILARKSGAEYQYRNVSLPWPAGNASGLSEKALTDAGEIGFRLTSFLASPDGLRALLAQGSQKTQGRGESQTEGHTKRDKDGQTGGVVKEPTAKVDWRSIITRWTVSSYDDNFPGEPAPTVHVEDHNNVPGGDFEITTYRRKKGKRAKSSNAQTATQASS